MISFTRCILIATCMQVPIQDNAEKISELGVKDAWKERK